MILNLLVVFFSLNYVTAQVTISPEVGVSYLPYKIYGANSEAESNRLDILLGLTARVNILKKWYVNTRVTFINREDVRWTDLCFCPGYEYTEYRNNDLNMDFNGYYKIYKPISIGAGASVIRKLNTSLYEKHNLIEDNFISQNRFIAGANLSANIDLGPFYLTMMYMRKIHNHEITVYRLEEGRDRFDLTVSYRLGFDN